MSKQKKVFLTGCSSGIGLITALRFARKGWNVFASVRKESDAQRLKAQGNIRVLILDVTDREACQRAFETYGPFDAVVNNAGFGQMGPLEDVSEEELRYQFEVNVFAIHRIIRLALPHMRQKRSGCIVNVGSVVGRFTFPLGGAYCATKHALRAMSDALRAELLPYGVRVVLIEPGPVATGFTDRAEKSFAQDRTGAYSDWRKAASILFKERGVKGASPERVAKVIVRCCENRFALSKIVITKRGWMMIWLRRLLPDFIWDRLMVIAAGAWRISQNKAKNDG